MRECLLLSLCPAVVDAACALWRGPCPPETPDAATFAFFLSAWIGGWGAFFYFRLRLGRR